MGRGDLRWDCDKKGCFNKLKRPKWGVFADCFSRNSTFGDIDAVIDNKGERFLFVEWKCAERTDVDVGQSLLFKGLTRLSPLIVVVIVFGDAETMDVSGIRVVSHGCVGGLERIDLEGLKNRLRDWWAKGLVGSERQAYERQRSSRSECR